MLVGSFDIYGENATSVVAHYSIEPGSIHGGLLGISSLANGARVGNNVDLRTTSLPAHGRLGPRHQPRGVAGCGPRLMPLDVSGAQALGCRLLTGTHPHRSSGALRALWGRVCDQSNRSAHRGGDPWCWRRPFPGEGRGCQARLRGFQSACGRGGDKPRGQAGGARRVKAAQFRETCVEVDAPLSLFGSVRWAKVSLRPRARKKPRSRKFAGKVEPCDPPLRTNRCMCGVERTPTKGGRDR